VADTGPAAISVLAGVNGAGKSSLFGSLVEESDATYVDPDARTREILASEPQLTLTEANSRAWKAGRKLLHTAVENRESYAFETTLGGRSIAADLKAAAQVMPVRVWYVGLASPEMHIQRVQARVAAGGHDIPEDKIRSRYERSRINLIDLLPDLLELRVYDNSAEGDPKQGQRPTPRLLLEMRAGRIVGSVDLDAAPDWAKPILAAALLLESGA